MPGKIEALEAEQSQLHMVMADGEFYKQQGNKIVALVERLESLTTELEECYVRWESLESQAKAATIG